MSKELDDKLDQRIRSVMENAEEPVPEHVWAAISDRLDAKKPPMVVPVWLRVSAVSIAAAAVVVLGIILFLRPDKPLVNDQTAEVAETAVTNPPETTTIEAAELTVPDLPLIAMSSDEEDGIEVSPIDIPATYEIGELVVEPLEKPSAAAAQEEEPKTVTVGDEAWDLDAGDLLASGATSQKRGKIRTEVVMSGDAMSNAGFSTSSTPVFRRQLSSSIVSQTKPGISESSESSYGIPASFGLGVKIIFTPRWSLGVGVNYSLMTRSFAGSYTTLAEDGGLNITTNYSKIRHNLSYIGIPVNAYFSIVKSRAVDFYAYAGGTVERAISNRYELETDGIFKDKIKGLQFSADVGIGVEFIIVDMLGIYIDPSLRYYFPSDSQPKSIRTQEPLTFGFEIGLRIRL